MRLLQLSTVIEQSQSQIRIMHGKVLLPKHSVQFDDVPVASLGVTKEA